MRAGRESVAYEQFEEHAIQEQQNNEQDFRVVSAPRRRKKRMSQMSIFSCIGVVVIAAICVLFCEMQLTQLTAQVSAKTKMLEELSAENVSMSSKQINSMDMGQVEAYATKALGMVKMDNSQIEYIEMKNPDVVTVAERKLSLDTIISRLSARFMQIVEYIR